MPAARDFSQSLWSVPVQQTLSLPFHTTNLLIITASLRFNCVPAFCVTEVSGGKRHTWLLRVVREWQGTGEVGPGDVLYMGTVSFRFVYTLLLTAGTKRIQDCQMPLKVNRCHSPSKATINK